MGVFASSILFPHISSDVMLFNLFLGSVGFIEPCLESLVVLDIEALSLGALVHVLHLYVP